MAYDKGDYHFDDAGSWEKACRHIGLFLHWAAERGLTNPEFHPDRAAIAPDPTAYFISACDTKLWEDDFSEVGNTFAKDVYTQYLGEVHAFAASRGIRDYEIAPDAATRDHFFAWLDARAAARGVSLPSAQPPATSAPTSQPSPKATATAEPEAQTKAKPKPTTKAKTSAKARIKPKAKAKAPRAKAKAKPKTTAKAKAKPKTTAKTKPKAKAKATAKAQMKPKTKA